MARQIELQSFNVTPGLVFIVYMYYVAVIAFSHHASAFHRHQKWHSVLWVETYTLVNLC